MFPEMIEFDFPTKDGIDFPTKDGIWLSYPTLD
jgi:hypothetical protein